MKRRTNLSRRLKPIKLVILDADGVLTDNCIFISDSGEKWQKFSIADGMGISLGQKHGLTFAVISGNPSQAIAHRARELGVPDCFVGVKSKVPIFEQLKAKYGAANAEIAYVGNDINDLALLRQVGLAACVRDAIGDIQKHCHYVAKHPGGECAVREIVELILKGQKKKLVW